jgi:hypothetical protein
LAWVNILASVEALFVAPRLFVDACG